MAPGSMTMSPTRAAGFPPIRQMPLPPSGTGVVTPGPCGVPEQAGGGALGIGQVCWSPIRQAGFPPINTVGHGAPNRGDPCDVVSPSRAAGLPIFSPSFSSFRRARFRQLDDRLDSENPNSDHRRAVTRIDELDPIAPGKPIVGPRCRSLDDDCSTAQVAYLQPMAASQRLRRLPSAASHRRQSPRTETVVVSTRQSARRFQPKPTRQLPFPPNSPSAPRQQKT